jgi:hypothetical protein
MFRVTYYAEPYSTKRHTGNAQHSDGRGSLYRNTSPVKTRKRLKINVVRIPILSTIGMNLTDLMIKTFYK